MVMRTMRNNIGILQWMFVLLLIVFGLGLVLPSGSRELATAAAIVDGQPVDGQRYSRVVQTSLESQRQAQGGELSDGQSQEIRLTVLNSLIEEELALSHADALGQKTSVDEFRQAVLNDSSFKDDKGNYDPARYQQLLIQQAQQQGLDWKQAEANFQRGILMQKVRAFFSDQALLTPAEQAQAEAKLNRQVRVEAAVWDLARLKGAQALTEEDVRAYYSENKQKWAKPQQVKLRQILVKTDFATATATAKAKADGLLAKLKAGADFKALAKAENTDTASKDNGGDLGWVSRTDLRDAQLGSEAMRLKKGQLSDVVKTSEGYHILKAEDTKGGFEPTYDNSKAKAKDELATQRASRQAGEFAFQALADLKKGSTLAAAAKAHQGSVVTSGWFGRDSEQALPALGKAPQFAQRTLNMDKGETPTSPSITDKATAFAVIIDEKAGGAPAKAEAAAARKAQALGLARSQKAEVLYNAWMKSLRDEAKIKDQVGVLPAAK